MTTRGVRTFAAAVVGALALYLAGPQLRWWDVVFQVGIGVGLVFGMLAGVRTMRRSDQWPWCFLAAGLLCTAIAPLPSDLGTDWITGSGPDVGEYLYLGFYPAVACGVGLMIRQRQRRIDWAALVDALTVTAGIGLLAWAYAIAPELRLTQESLLTRLVTVAYPVGDLVLLTMTLLLLRSNGRSGRRAPRLVAVSNAGYLAGDWAWVVLPHLGGDWAGMWWVNRGINALYLLSLLVMALAASCPPARGDGPGAAAASQLTRRQLAVLTAAVLIAPGLLISEQLSGRIADGYAVALGAATMFLLVMLRFMQLLKQAERQSRVVRELSRRDELTGLPNRRAWSDVLPRVLEQTRADTLPVTVGMIDLDHFKVFNDTYGHPAGDRLLKEAAAAWHGELRRSDVLARYGGEEFILLLPGADLGEATAVVERLRKATPLSQTFSAGLAGWDGVETSENLIARADTALYAAKTAGRDRVVPAVSPSAHG